MEAAKRYLGKVSTEGGGRGPEIWHTQGTRRSKYSWNRINEEEGGDQLIEARRPGHDGPVQGEVAHWLFSGQMWSDCNTVSKGVKWSAMFLKDQSDSGAEQC